MGRGQSPDKRPSRSFAAQEDGAERLTPAQTILKTWLIQFIVTTIRNPLVVDGGEPPSRLPSPH